jgi:hypothetical protein
MSVRVRKAVEGPVEALPLREALEPQATVFDAARAAEVVGATPGGPVARVAVVATQAAVAAAVVAERLRAAMAGLVVAAK